MRFQKFSFGSIRIDGITHEHDVVIDRGKIRKRKKKPSKKFREAFGPHPNFHRGRDTLEVQAFGDRDRHRRSARHGRGEERSYAPQNQTRDPADEEGDCRTEAGARQNQRHPACHMLRTRSDQPRSPEGRRDRSLVRRRCGAECAHKVRTSGLRSHVFATPALQLALKRQDLARLAPANTPR